MLLSLALTALALSPAQQAAPAPQLVLARLEGAPAPAPSGLAQRIAEARRRVAPAAPAPAVARMREAQQRAALFPSRPEDGLGSAVRRVALGEQAQRQFVHDPRLGSQGRRAALSHPQLPKRRPSRGPRR